MKWFRFWDEALDDPKVQRLAPAMFKHWVNLLCLANRGTPRGTLPSLDAIAFCLRLKPAAAQAVISALQTTGLLDGEGDIVTPHNWQTRQPLRDDIALRVTRHRDAERVTESVTSALPLTRARRTEAEEKQRRGETEAEEKTEDCAAVYRAYEECCGSFDSYMGSLLDEATAEFGATCLVHCFQEAIELNKRSWRYVKAIAKRHAKDGCAAVPEPNPQVEADREWAENRRRMMEEKVAKRNAELNAEPGDGQALTPALERATS